MQEHHVNELPEDNLCLDEDDLQNNFRTPNRPRWLSILVGIGIIMIFAYLLFAQDNSTTIPKGKPIAVIEQPSVVEQPAVTQPPVQELPLPVSQIVPCLLPAVSQIAAIPVDRFTIPLESHEGPMVIDKVIVIPKVQKSTVPNASVSKPIVKQSTVSKKNYTKNQSYTIQLLAMSNQRALTQFVALHHLAGKVHFFKTTRQGKTWYILTYGTYDDYQEAHAALKLLSPALKKSNPWPKRMASYG